VIPFTLQLSLTTAFISGGSFLLILSLPFVSCLLSTTNDFLQLFVRSLGRACLLLARLRIVCPCFSWVSWPQFLLHVLESVVLPLPIELFLMLGMDLALVNPGLCGCRWVCSGCIDFPNMLFFVTTEITPGFFQINIQGGHGVFKIGWVKRDLPSV
jgi:hypothetical protein